MWLFIALKNWWRYHYCAFYPQNKLVFLCSINYPKAKKVSLCLYSISNAIPLFLLRSGLLLHPTHSLLFLISAAKGESYAYPAAYFTCLRSTRSLRCGFWLSALYFKQVARLNWPLPVYLLTARLCYAQPNWWFQGVLHFGYGLCWFSVCCSEPIG